MYTVVWNRYPNGNSNEDFKSSFRDFGSLCAAKKFLQGKLMRIDNFHWAGGYIVNEAGEDLIRVLDTKEYI